MSWLLALSVAPTLAHLPHDGALFAASWPGGGSPVVTTIYRDSGVLLTRLGDGPTDSESRFMAPQRDDVRTVAYVDADRLVAAVATDGLWVSDDRGDTWVIHPDLADEPLVGLVTASPAVHQDGIALVGATSGIWRTDDRGDTWDRVWETTAEVLAISWSDAWPETPRVCALTDADQVTCSDDAGQTWTGTRATPESLTDLAVSGDRTLWGAGLTGLWRVEGEETWTRTSLKGAIRYTTLLSDGTLLAVRDEEAVWRSDDDGATWSLCPEGLPESLDGVGAPRDGIYYRQLVQESTGRVLLATWSGLYASDDGGATWFARETEMPWTTRAIDLGWSSSGAPWALIGKYGGGSTLVRVDGTEPQPVGGEMDVRYTRSVALGAGDGEAQVLAITDYDSVEISHDGGRTWTSTAGTDWIEVGYVDVEDDGSDGTLAVLAGEDLDGSTLARSVDGGLTWEAAESDADCFGGRRLIDLPPDWNAQPEAWAGCRTDASLFVSTDRGVSWTGLGSPTPIWLMQLRGLPGEPAAYAATTEGLYRVTTSGEATLVAFEDTQVSSLGVSRGWASDGTAFVLVASQGWFRTTDHGETWTALPRPTLSHAETLQVSPDYPLDQSLAVGTYDGAWASQDGGETWTEITAADRIEEDHGLWDFSDGWVLERSETLSGGMHLAADGPDLTAEVAFEGVACDLIGGTYVGGGSLAVAIDGGDETRIDLYSVQRQEQVTLLRVQDLAPGPHTLSIRVVSEPAGIDALVGWHVAPPDAPLRDTGDSSDSGMAGDTGGPGDSGDPSRCRGCATAPAGALAPALWLLTALGLTRRRRRTYSTPTRGSARSWGGPMRR